MKDILSWAGLAAIFAFGSVVSTCSNHLESSRVRADEVESQEWLSGFAGYAYGSGDLFIRNDMEAEGWEMFDSSDQAVWYKATMLGYPVQLGYVFTDNQLVGGAWVFLDTSQEAFTAVADYLQDSYGDKVDIEIDGSRMEQTHTGPDSVVVHLIDAEAGNHEVIYRKQP